MAILSQDEQKALAEVYERSFVTQGATDTAAQVPVRTLLVGAEETMGTRSTVAKRRTQAIMMNFKMNEGDRKCWRCEIENHFAKLSAMYTQPVVRRKSRPRTTK